LINEYSQLQILRSIKDNISQPKIAKEVGFSLGKVNFVLQALVEKGLIKVENFGSSKNKVKYKYLLTKEGIKEKISLTKKFIERKKEEYEQLQQELENYTVRYGVIVNE